VKEIDPRILKLENVRYSDFFPNEEMVILLGFLIFIAGFMIMKSVFKRNYLISTLVPLIKASLFVAYNLFFFKESFNTIDAYNYLDLGVFGAQKYEGFFPLLIDILTLKGEGIYGHTHYVFYAFISLLFELFGSYSAQIPIAGSIVITFFSGLVFYKITLLMGLKKYYAKWAFLLFVMHWDIITWSTITLVKDNLVALLFLLIVYFFCLFFKNQFRWYHLFYLIVACITLIFLRFYVLPVIVLAFLVFSYLNVFTTRLSVKSFYLTILVPLITFLVASAMWERYSAYLPYIMSFSGDPFYGSFRFFLTPTPLYISSKFSFLYPATILNWTFLPFTLFGMLICFRKKGIGRMLFIIFVVTVLFYAIIQPHGGETGPRHRLQITFLIILFQFMGLVKMIFPKVKLFDASKS